MYQIIHGDGRCLCEVFTKLCAQNWVVVLTVASLGILLSSDLSGGTLSLKVHSQSILRHDATHHSQCGHSA